MSWKTDVFAFGIILFELLSGKRSAQLNLKGGLFWQWAKDYFNNKDFRILSFVDSSLIEEVNSPNGIRRAMAIIQVALSCIDENMKNRPTSKKLKEFFENL